MEHLDAIIAMIQHMDGSLLAGIAAVLEVVLRLVKSDKPLSILHLLGSGAKKLGALLSAIGDLSDKVLPQRLS